MAQIHRLDLRIDLERARTRVLNARQTRIEQQAAYRGASQELARLTSLSPQAIQLPDVARFPAIPANAAQSHALALVQNPEILALKSDIEAQQSRVKAEMSKYLPVVGLSLERDVSKNVQGTNGPHTDTRALVVVNWATSLGGKEWFQAEQARSEMRAREAKLTDESQRLTQAIEADHALLQSAVLRMQTAQQEQTSASTVVDAVAEQLQIGRLGSLLDALDASERYFQARQRLAQAIGQNIKAHAQILQRIGQLRDRSTAEWATANRTPPWRYLFVDASSFSAAPLVGECLHAPEHQLWLESLVKSL